LEEGEKETQTEINEVDRVGEAKRRKKVGEEIRGKQER